MLLGGFRLNARDVLLEFLSPVLRVFYYVGIPATKIIEMAEDPVTVEQRVYLAERHEVIGI